MERPEASFSFSYRCSRFTWFPLVTVLVDPHIFTYAMERKHVLLRMWHWKQSSASPASQFSLAGTARQVFKHRRQCKHAPSGHPQDFPEPARNG